MRCKRATSACWSSIAAAIVLSRLLALGMTVLFAGDDAAVHAAPRELDATRLLFRLRPRSLFRTGSCSCPGRSCRSWRVSGLRLAVGWGYEGGAAKKQAKDYWRKNLATYRDAKVPDIEHVELELDLFPERMRYHARGKYVLVNPDEQAARARSC